MALAYVLVLAIVAFGVPLWIWLSYAREVIRSKTPPSTAPCSGSVLL